MTNLEAINIVSDALIAEHKKYLKKFDELNAQKKKLDILAEEIYNELQNNNALIEQRANEKVAALEQSLRAASNEAYMRKMSQLNVEAEAAARLMRTEERLAKDRVDTLTKQSTELAETLPDLQAMHKEADDLTDLIIRMKLAISIVPLEKLLQQKGLTGAEKRAWFLAKNMQGKIHSGPQPWEGLIPIPLATQEQTHKANNSAYELQRKEEK